MELMLSASFVVYLVSEFLVSFEPVYTLLCSMWWALYPDGFWVKAVQMPFKSVLTPIPPPLVPTPVLFFLSHFYRKHTCPLHFSPSIRRVSMLPLFQGQVSFKEKKKKNLSFLYLLWKCQIL
jgi:hypothetical protein